jgi:hypothetical protein
MNSSYMRFVGSVIGAVLFLNSPNGLAVDLDWSGQFRAETHWVDGYQMGDFVNRDAARVAAKGYYIPGGGSDEAQFQTLFLKLRPKVIVNDNIYIKSELAFGDPVYGLFGGASPYPADQRQFNSTSSRGSSVTAQRFWGEFVSDLGTFQIGRAPMHYGLGLVWNSGDNVFDRYQSTGDTFRLVSKFGSFSFVPAITKYTLGNNIGGSCTYATATGLCSPGVGGAGVSDYSLTFKFEDPDQDFEGGVNFIKRVSGAAQDPNGGIYGTQSGTTVGSNYNTWDLYGRRSFGRFSLAGELPIVSGSLGQVDYSTFAVAVEAKVKATESLELFAKGGQAPGQPNDVSTTPSKYKAFYFHQNYKIGLIMFNYQLANFAGPNTQNNPNIPSSSLVSPFDNPITNARYLNWGASYHLDKWAFRGNFVWAKAMQAAEVGSVYYNSWLRQSVSTASTPGKIYNQSKDLGWEMDYGTSFKWDDAFQLDWDFGWFFPGDFYKFSNNVYENSTSTVFATALKLGVSF